MTAGRLQRGFSPRRRLGASVIRLAAALVLVVALGACDADGDDSDNIQEPSVDGGS